MDLKTISQLVSQVRSMPTMSPIALRLLSLSADDDHDLREMVELIKSDTFLTMQILKVANSAAHSTGRQVNSLTRAVVALGSNLVVGIALKSCAPGMFNTRLLIYNSSESKLWEHSLYVGLAAKQIAAQMTGGCNPEMAFTAGLLHDVGKVVMDQLFQQVQRPSIGLHEVRRQAMCALERDALGLDHATLGYWLANHWSLPPELGQPMLYHHNPNEAPEELVRLCSAVHYGDLMAHRAGYCAEGRREEMMDTTPVTGARMQAIMTDVTTQFEVIREAVLGSSAEEEQASSAHQAHELAS